MNEQWLTIPEFPDYAVSSHGRIRRDVPDRLGRFQGLIKKAFKLPSGGWTMRMSRDGVKYNIIVSRTVCAAFHGPCSDDNMNAMHIDGDMDNNRADNLRWATFKEILARMKADDVFKNRVQGMHTHPLSHPYGVNHRSSKLDPQKVREIRASSEKPMVLARRYGVAYQSINLVRERKSWAHVR